LPSAIRVLVAEDNAINQKVAMRLLEKLGCRVDVAATGKEAVEMIELLPYDLVFMDCQMPEMDGFEATRLVRQKEMVTGRHVPIVAMTAHAMQGDRENCLAAGMDDYIAKPVQQQQLSLALETFASTSVEAEPERVADADCRGDEVLNQAALLARMNGDVELLREIAALFLENSPRLLDEIRRAIAHGRNTELATAAHAVKGSVITFAARAAADTAQQLELMGRNQELTHPDGQARATALCARLEETINRLQSALARLMREEEKC
jgi:CheY-like chemotaxis protein